MSFSFWVVAQCCSLHRVPGVKDGSLAIGLELLSPWIPTCRHSFVGQLVPLKSELPCQAKVINTATGVQGATLRYRTSRSVPFVRPKQQSIIHVRSVFTLKFPARAPVLFVVVGPADITAREVTFGHRRSASRAVRGQPTRQSSYFDMSIGAPDNNAALTSIRPSKNVEFDAIETAI